MKDIKNLKKLKFQLYEIYNSNITKMDQVKIWFDNFVSGTRKDIWREVWINLANIVCPNKWNYVKQLIDEHGNDKAELLYLLGYMFNFGEGFPQDNLIAFRLFERSFEKGNQVAFEMIYYFYMNCADVKIDTDKLKTWSKMAIQKSDLKLLDRLGNIYYHKLKNYDKSYEIYSLASSHGCVDSLCNIASMYYNGHGLPLDYYMAFKQFSKVLEMQHTHPVALYSLGECYAKGNGTFVDPYMAFRYYTLAVTRIRGVHSVLAMH